MSDKDRPLTIAVEGDELVIRIGVDVLVDAAMRSEAFIPFDDEANDFVEKFHVSDKHAFARGVAIELKDEDPDDGSTALTRNLDECFLRCIENDYGIKETKTLKATQ